MGHWIGITGKPLYGSGKRLMVLLGLPLLAFQYGSLFGANGDEKALRHPRMQWD